MVNQRNAKAHREFPGVYEPALPPGSGKLPGFGGPRPELAFVLRTLASGDPGMIRRQMGVARRVSQSNPEALERLLADPQSIKTAEASMVAMMRQLTDLWIDSGKDDSNRDVDTPADRNAEKIPPRHSKSLKWLLEKQFLNTHARWTEIGPDGKLNIIDAPPIFNSDFLQEDVQNHALQGFGQETAMYWFVKFLNSPYSRLIARCDHCNSYFARTRERAVKTGVFCLKCNGEGSLKRTKSSRLRRKQELVKYAADSWEQQVPNSRQGSRSKWVAEKVNLRTENIAVKAARKSESHYPIITGRWVTQHQSEIEAEVKRRNHATRKG
jgi:hypothetical protein